MELWCWFLFFAGILVWGVVGFLWGFRRGYRWGLDEQKWGYDLGYRRGVHDEKERLPSFSELMQKLTDRRRRRGNNISDYWRTFGKKTKPQDGIDTVTDGKT